jgi:enamine deaminase RidA (YjgF/YER057c/UK114 family)
MQKHFVNPESLPDWSTMFTQVVVVEHDGLKFLHVSGQVGVDQDKLLTGNGNFREQTRQSLTNLQRALASGGATIRDVVKLVIYVVNYQNDLASVIREELLRVFPKDRLPALSLIGVAALAEERFLIEIDAEVISHKEG